MIVRVRQFLNPPVFEDEDKTRTANLLNTISLSILFVTLLGSVTIFFQGFILDGILIIGALILLELAVQLLLRRGRVQLGSILQIGLLWSIFTYISFTSGGVRAATYGSCVTVVLLAGLLLGSYFGIGAAVVSIVSGFVMLFAEDQGLITFVGADRISAVLANASQFVVSAVIVHLAIRGIRDALDRAQRSNRELQTTQTALEERIEVEQEQREQLQVLISKEQEQREQLQHLLEQIQEAAGNLAAAAVEVLTTTTQQASGATEQATAIAQATTTIDEVRAIAEQTVQRAQMVADLALRTNEVSLAGQEAVADSIQGMEEVKQKAESVAQDVLDLSDLAQTIGQIITAVNEIAGQSNMLALNAAVEAARAGEQGRGFAVVAQEVRSLAEQSRAATEQVQAILTEIQGGINIAVMTAEESMKGAGAGVRLTGEAGLTINQLAESITESTQAAAQIVAAADQQLAGVEQIGTAMESIQQTTAESVTSAQQVERTAGELNALAGRLNELVEQYRA